MSVHPRACGEQDLPLSELCFKRGSSPRVRGTARCMTRPTRAWRFIPARAGNRPSARSGACSSSVHPRACGEQMAIDPDREGIAGSSPRVRGTVGLPGFTGYLLRFIPARAGNRPCRRRARIRATVHPRACGEQITSVTTAADSGGSSPRVRGTGFHPIDVKRDGRFIPARAGNR